MNEDLDIGSVLACKSRIGDDVYLNKIKRITSTMFILDNGVKVRRKGLTIVGADGFGPFSARVPTDNDFMMVRIRVVRNALKALKVDKSNVCALEAALGISPNAELTQSAPNAVLSGRREKTD